MERATPGGAARFVCKVCEYLLPCPDFLHATHTRDCRQVGKRIGTAVMSVLILFAFARNLKEPLICPCGCFSSHRRGYRFLQHCLST